MTVATHIIEFDQERDRKTCIALEAKVTGSNRELAQWLLDHPRYSAAVVSEWLNCGKSRIVYLRQWAKGGFVGAPFNSEQRQERDNKRAAHHGDQVITREFGRGPGPGSRE